MISVKEGNKGIHMEFNDLIVITQIKETFPNSLLTNLEKSFRKGYVKLPKDFDAAKGDGIEITSKGFEYLAARRNFTPSGF